ncbi:hypothetical protein KM176_23055 [Pseudooceanicola sp. CBS1P-1]|uniref:Uncharacterized protein n=1 Tax=Pseudooceanicola albus TaxID=2692189 RepID=A0A6L7GAR9_9RHOB|nr:MULTISPECIES: hypothetical protein [Pseudooceanicola]MBT9386745.1 hypothetical protein [Pseudooceanicola endophyticus]MXN20772.1 hypothetical protein [Pseudooceanicola albus]
MIGTGLSLGALAPRFGRASGQLNAYTYAGHVPRMVWDFETGYLSELPLPLQRASLASQTDRNGVLLQARKNEPRFAYPGGRRALLLEASASNICHVYTVPTLNAKLSAASPAVLSLVDASAALSTAGLRQLTGPYAYRINNSANASYVFCVLESAPAGTQTHLASAWARKVSGSGTQNVVRVDGAAGEQSASITSSGFALYTTMASVPANSKRMLIRVEPGSVIDFVLPWYRPSTDTSSYVLSDATGQARAADTLILSTALYGLATDQQFRAVRSDGEVTLQAVSGTLTLPAGKYHLLHDLP